MKSINIWSLLAVVFFLNAVLISAKEEKSEEIKDNPMQEQSGRDKREAEEEESKDDQKPKFGFPSMSRKKRDTEEGEEEPKDDKNEAAIKQMNGAIDKLAKSAKDLIGNSKFGFFRKWKTHSEGVEKNSGEKGDDDASNRKKRELPKMLKTPKDSHESNESKFQKSDETVANNESVSGDSATSRQKSLVHYNIRELVEEKYTIL